MAIGVIGCSDSDELDCEKVAFATCDIREDSCQSKIFDAMRCLRGGGQHTVRPSVTLMSEQQVQRLFEAAARDEGVDEDTIHARNALALLGLAEPEVVEIGAAVNVRLEGLLGFYSTADNEIVVLQSDDTNFSGPRAVTTLGHEFVHALQHADFGVDRYRERVSTSFDSALAATGIVEGEATLYEEFFDAELRGHSRHAVNWRIFFEDLTDAADAFAAENPPPEPLAFSLFPYTYAAHSTFEEWDSWGSAGIAGMRDSGSPSTLDVLARRVAQETEGGLAPLAGPGEPAGFAEAGYDTLGAWLLHGFAVHVLKDDVRPGRALDWRGDRLNVFGSAEGTGAIWSIRWSGSEAAQEFVDEVARLEAPVRGVWGVWRRQSLTHLVVTDGGPDSLQVLEQASRQEAEAVELSPPASGGGDAGSTAGPDNGDPASAGNPLRVLLRRPRASCFQPSIKPGHDL